VVKKTPVIVKDTAKVIKKVMDSIVNDAILKDIQDKPKPQKPTPVSTPGALKSKENNKSATKKNK